MLKSFTSPLNFEMLIFFVFFYYKTEQEPRRSIVERIINSLQKFNAPFS